MALAGPRLDRPTAVGDEGRPRAASLTVVTVLVLLLAIAVGSVLGDTELVVTLATLAGLTAAGVALLDRERSIAPFVGHLLLATFGGVLALFVAGVVLGEGREGIAVAGLQLAVLGLAVTWADVGNEAGARRAAFGGLVTASSLLFSILIIGYGLTVVLTAVFLLLVIADIASTSPAGSLFLSLVLLGSTAFLVRLSFEIAPIGLLVPRSRRNRFDERLRRVGWGVVWLGVGSILLAVVVVAVWGVGAFDALATLFPTVATALTVLSTAPVVAALASAGVGSIVLATLAWGVRWLAQDWSGRSTRLGAGIAAGVFLATLATPVFLVLFVLVPVYALLLLLLVLIAVIFVSLGATILLGAMEIGLLPDRAGGPAFVAVALVMTAVGLGGEVPALLFATVAVAILAWDLSTFGLGLTAELGHLPDTRRLELFHAGIAVGIGILVVAVLTAIDAVRLALSPALGSTVSLALVVFGALLLLVPLRG